MHAGHRIPVGIGGGGFYSATKHALRALTEGLRQEARANGVPLRVSMVSPGVVHTEFFSVMSNSDPETIRTYRELPGLTPGDVASSVLYALAAPPHVEVDDVLIRPTYQAV
jgi:NADP-dependent 3-hydroxy acid dehydrogenase YdfG